jgi:Cd2+/Zn2+-exporting ATPase
MGESSQPGHHAETTWSLRAPVTNHADSCVDLLLQSIASRAGVLSVSADREQRLLTIRYDPARVAMRQVSALARALGVELGRRFDRCTLETPDLQCRDCPNYLERALHATPGVTYASVNPSAFHVAVEYDPAKVSVAQIERRIARAGVRVRGEEEALPLWRRQARAIATTVCGIGLLAGVIGSHGGAPGWLVAAAYVVAYVAGGVFTLPEVFQALRVLRIEINVLMVAAALGAGVIGHWDDGAVLLFLFSLSNTLEKFAMGRTRRAVQALLEMTPRDALLVRDGAELHVPIEQLRPGDIIRVRPGDCIAAEGVVVAGQSSVNQAAITGESVPVDVAPGDAVLSGTINQHGALDVRVGRSAAQSALAQIVRVVEEAQTRKAATQRAIERFGEIYAPVVLGLAALAIALPWLTLGVPFETAFYRGMVLLVAASPCALIIATPSAALSAIANGARRGILFKSSNAVEDVSRLRAVAFDKTGTLTLGRPEVTDVAPTERIEPVELLRVAASAEQRSEHPLAQAVVQRARAERLELENPTEFLAFPGQGVHAEVAGRTIWVGNDKLLRRASLALTAEQTAARDRLASEGKTVVHVFDECGLLGLIALADQPRPEAAAVVQRLHRLGLRTAMLTGDNEVVARAIAARLGIDEVHAGLSPQQKVDVVKQLGQVSGGVAMVGDGVNDAPALASSRVGIAMGAAGSDVALETADVVLMGDDLGSIPYLAALGRKARRVVKQNLVFALAVIVALVTLNFCGLLTLPIGVIGHEGSTLLVALNGLRLLRPLR